MEPSYDWTNNPDVGRADFYRYQDAYVMCWTDSGNGLRACHSTVPLGNGTEPDCGPQGVLPPVDVQDVLANGNWHQVLQGPVWITIRDLSSAGECFDATLVAQGDGRLQNTDNDVLGVEPGAKNANAFGWMAEGSLMSPTGQTMMYSGHARAQYSEQGGFFRGKNEVTLH